MNFEWWEFSAGNEKRFFCVGLEIFSFKWSPPFRRRKGRLELTRWPFSWFCEYGFRIMSCRDDGYHLLSRLTVSIYQDSLIR